MYTDMLGALIVVAVACVAMSTGSIIKTDSDPTVKQSWVTYRTQGQEAPVKEKVVVVDNEEDITVPGKLRIILDYDSQTMVSQMDSVLGENDQCMCYVADFDDVYVPFGQKPVKLTHDNETRLTEFSDHRVMLKGTGELVDSATLSPKARDMCFGCKTEKAVDSHVSESDREKRWGGAAVCYGCGAACSGWCFWLCSLSCILTSGTYMVG